jgi:hypothetical protein
MSTGNTNKPHLRLAIRRVAVPAFVAGLRRVAGIYRCYLDADFRTNVRDFLKQRSERPAVLNQSLLFRHANAAANALQVFDGDYAGVDSLGFADKLVRHIPQQPFDRALLFPCQPFDKLPLIRSLVPCSLERATLFESLLLDVLNASAFENFACAGRSALPPMASTCVASYCRAYTLQL